jgi:hypothetical protein
VPLSCFPNGNTESIARVKKKVLFWGGLLGNATGRTPSSNKLRSSAAGKHILSAAAKKFGFKASGPE